MTSAPPSPGTKPSNVLSREELCRRIDDELARLDLLATNSWMWRPREVIEPEDDRPIASPTDVDAVVGGLLWMERDTLDKESCLHVFAADRLLALLCPRTSQVSVRANVARQDLAPLRCERRPGSAASAPPGFRTIPAAQVLWRFALYGAGGASVLPPRYFKKPITLRKLPQVEPEMMPLRVIHLLQKMNRKPVQFDELLASCSDGRDQLVRDLAALFLVRSISVSAPP